MAVQRQKAVLRGVVKKRFKLPLPKLLFSGLCRPCINVNANFGTGDVYNTQRSHFLVIYSLFLFKFGRNRTNNELSTLTRIYSDQKRSISAINLPE